MGPRPSGTWSLELGLGRNQEQEEFESPESGWTFLQIPCVPEKLETARESGASSTLRHLCALANRAAHLWSAMVGVDGLSASRELTCQVRGHMH